MICSSATCMPKYNLYIALHAYLFVAHVQLSYLLTTNSHNYQPTPTTGQEHRVLGGGGLTGADYIIYKQYIMYDQSDCADHRRPNMALCQNSKPR